MEVVCRGMEFSVKALHSDTTPELDSLLELFDEGKLDDQGINTLQEMLIGIKDDADADKTRRVLAHNVLLLVRMKYGASVA